MEVIKSGTCAIYSGADAHEALEDFMSGRDFSKTFLLTDSNTEVYCLPKLLERLPQASGWTHLCIPEGETHKNIHTCLKIWEALSDNGADRKSLLINLGGGVVTDLGGFVACTYQRGIPFINVPTSLLAMVDASVGGKTGVDLGSLKNQIGVIRDPQLVLIWPEYLSTLDSRQVRSGFAEMLKHGLIRDRSYWNTLKEVDNLHGLDSHISRSIHIKNEVVLSDPTEKNQRKILNFGHTLGHAIESFYLQGHNAEPLLHGEAIAAGMILEAYLSAQLCGLSVKECDEIRDGISKFFPRVLIKPEHREPILDLLRFDKKNAHGKVLFSLLESIGQAKYNVEVSGDQLSAAFDYYMV
jgi:3-dehydroquinate synthase